MTTRRYDGAVGDDACVAFYDGETIVGLHRAPVVGQAHRAATGDIVIVECDGRMWFRRDNGTRLTYAGKPYTRDTGSRLRGPWLYGDTSSFSGVEACAAAIRQAAGDGVADPRQQAIARSVPALCDLFGVDQWTLRERLTSESHDMVALAHNGLRKFAVGAIVHLASEIDVAWTGRGGGVARQGLRAVSEVPQLEGIHRGTLGRFRDQFAVLCGLGVDERGKVREPLSGVGRFVRDRYAQIRSTAVAEAIAAVGAGEAG